MQDEPRVLLVEDSRTQALEMGERLRQEGMRVDYASSAREALDFLTENVPNLVILDYLLPATTGDELCRRIRTQAAARDVPVLMLTGSGSTDIERRSLEAGADDYVDKDEGYAVLLLRVQALLRRRPNIQEPFLPREKRCPRILAVDDSPTYLALISEMLTTDGYQVETATTGAEALNRFARHRHDAVVLDLHLPDMDGHELCRRLSQINVPLHKASVLMVLTGESDSEEIARTLAEGADDAIHKSRDTTIIKARLGSLLRRKYAYEESERVLREFRDQELRLSRAEAARREAEEKAALAVELQRAYRELKNTQSQLVQSAKMASLGVLVAGIAHEINNPLGYVTSHLQTVRKGLDAARHPGLADEALQRLEKASTRLDDVRQGLERIRELVSKLRTFSRLDEGEIKTVDIHENLESVLTLLSHRIRENIRIQREYGPDGEIECQPGPLNQVWMNLLSNAIDAIPGEGSITLTTHRDHSTLTVTVTDTGQGMEDAVLQRIFEPFYTTKKQDQGTGLGLSISYGIIQAHGGHIEATSSVGGGSRFSVQLPLRAVSPDAH